MTDLSQLVTVLNSFVEKLGSIPQSPTPQPVESKVRNLLQNQSLNFESFEENNETFDEYIQRLENYFQLKGLIDDNADTEEAKKLILINCLGSKNYHLLSSLTAPDLPASKKYDELLKLLKEHLCKRINILTEQHKFLCRTQQPGESISSYITILKELVKNTDFKSSCNNQECSKSVVNLMLRAQFIRGLYDSDIREKILQQTDITFEKILEIALAIEASKIENKEIYKNVSMNYVKKISNYQNTSIQENRSRSRQKGKSNRSRSLSHNRKNIDFKEVGLDGLCLHCGRNNHKTNSCKIINKLKCQFCQKKGHVSKVCISQILKRKVNNSNSAVHQINDQNTEIINRSITDFHINHVFDVYTNLTEIDDRLFATIELNGKPCKFEIDSGSRVTLMNLEEFKYLNINAPIQDTNLCFRSYTGNIFKPVGFVELKVCYKNCYSLEKLYLVELNKEPIVGRDWIRNLKIDISQVNQTKIERNIDPTNITSIVNKIVKDYSDVFDAKVGKIPNYTCSLKMHENAKPIYVKPRPIPYSLRNEVDKELDKLVCEGIIEKVDYSEWGTPLVVVPKPDGSVRICADYKITVNKQLHDSRHPIPRIEDIFNKLRFGSYFCTLDIFKAYLHLRVDETSAKIQTISTHRGTYIAKRLFFGIKTAPNEFHKFIDQFVQDLDGVIAYFDDIIIQGQTYEQCHQRLIGVLDKLRAHQMHVNLNKCKFFERKVKYLGHIISAQGLGKSSDKVQAIQNAPRPKSVDELRQFLGMVMYYSKFIQNASHLLYPLNKLLRKDTPFKWSAECEAAFIKAKTEIVSDRILVPFNPDFPITLATDASPFGVAGVLSHKFPDGSEKPIAFASRSLTIAERNYSQLDKEATAVYWACKKFYDYIYGRKFTLIVDNKPMMSILHPNKNLPVMSAARMLRYAHFISNFDYSIIYRKSIEHTNVDYLSRNPLPLNKSEIQIVEDEHIYQEDLIQHISTDTLTVKDIRQETDRDKELSELKENLLYGNIYNPEISIQDGVLFRGQRVIIPKLLQPAILQELHSTHVGIVRMKALARNYCYWKNIDNDIEDMVKSCKNCCDVKKNPVKAPIHKWEMPTRNWQRLHIDYAGPFMNHYFLIVVDARSKWPEIYAQRTSPDSRSTIIKLREIFSRFGLPEILVSDNATIFKSKEFTDFCNRYGISQKFIAPGHPATNGQVERYCQTLKTKLKCMQSLPGDLHMKVCELLFRYRATPLSCGKTPAELLLGWNLRTKLDLLKPAPDKNKVFQEEQPIFNRNFKLGDRVQSRNYTNSNLWKYGVVVEKLGKLHYLIELDDGYVIKRHFNQLRLCQIDREVTKSQDMPRKKLKVTFSDQQETHIIPTRSYVPIPNTEVPDDSKSLQPEKQLNNNDNSYLNKASNFSNNDNSANQDPNLQSSLQAANQQPSQRVKKMNDKPKTIPPNNTERLRRSTRIKKPVQRLNL